MLLRWVVGVGAYTGMRGWLVLLGGLLLQIDLLLLSWWRLFFGAPVVLCRWLHASLAKRLYEDAPQVFVIRLVIKVKAEYILGEVEKWCRSTRLTKYLRRQSNLSL